MRGRGDGGRREDAALKAAEQQVAITTAPWFPPSLCSSSLITLSSFAPCCHSVRYASPSSHLSYSSIPPTPIKTPHFLCFIFMFWLLLCSVKKTKQQKDHLPTNKSPFPPRVSVRFTFVSVCCRHSPRVAVSRQKSSQQVFVSKKTHRRENKRRSLLSLLFYILLSFSLSCSFSLFLSTSTKALHIQQTPSEFYPLNPSSFFFLF